MRKACIEPIRFREDGTIEEVEMTSQGAGPALNAFEPIDGARACRMQGNVRIRLMAGRQDREELGAIHSGDAAVWKYIDFERGARRVVLRGQAPQGASVGIHLDSPDGQIIGTVQLPPAEEWQEVEAQVRKTQGKHALWLVFQPLNNEGEAGEENDRDIMNLDWLKFMK